jgi:hypothetical protein
VWPRADDGDQGFGVKDGRVDDDGAPGMHTGPEQCTPAVSSIASSMSMPQRAQRTPVTVQLYEVVPPTAVPFSGGRRPRQQLLVWVCRWRPAR